MHIKEMDLTLSKRGSMYFRRDSDNKVPVPIDTEEFLDQLNLLLGLLFAYSLWT